MKKLYFICGPRVFSEMLPNLYYFGVFLQISSKRKPSTYS